jgi:hypothetical protein
MLHVQLRDKPRLGHIWVTQLEAIDVEFTDGGPPKLKEWQIPEGDVDASHIELPWRVPRRVLEMSGAHEAEKRGDFVCAARLDRSQLPDLPVPCPHCWHTRSRCKPRCHPPHPTVALRYNWEKQGFCSKECHSSPYSRCAACTRHAGDLSHRQALGYNREIPEVAAWRQLYDSDDRPCKCCSSEPSDDIRALEWAHEVCNSEWHDFYMHCCRSRYDNEYVDTVDDFMNRRAVLRYLEERRDDAHDELCAARAAAVTR